MTSIMHPGLTRLPRLTPGKDITAGDINKLLEEIERAFRVIPGPGLVAQQTPAGLAISAPPQFPIIIQDTEPLPQNWPQLWLWVDTSTLHGEFYQVYIKTRHSYVNNDSKLAIALYE